MNISVFAFIALIISASFGYADSSCNSASSTKAFYECILKNHPEVKSAAINYDVAKATSGKTRQWPNPVLSAKSVGGQNAGENVGSTEVGVTIDVTELLIKRPALSSMGHAEEKALTVDAQEKEFKAKTQVIKDLFRYRQVVEELDLAVEALGTFNKIENQFKSRKIRGPEQEITLNLVELAQGEYELKKNHLIVEKAEIEERYKGIFGEQFEFKKELLPQLKTNWPDIKEAEVSKENFTLRKALAEKEKSEAEKSIANVDSWPKISAGPTAERNTQGLSQYTTYGFLLNVSIPIFSLNGGARELAEKNLIKAQYDYDYALKKADLERKLLIKKYQSSVDSLKRSAGQENLKKKHGLIDNLFRQGLSAGSTIIEAHRQIFGFTESRHEHEMTALDSLSMLNVLLNRDPGEVLK